MSSRELDGYRSGQPAQLADVLERVLDKGIVIAGDIQINLLDIELLTVKIRLLIASADKAREMGIAVPSSQKLIEATARKAISPNCAISNLNLITHHPQPRVPCQAPVNPRFEHVVHALGRWLPVETRAGIEATDQANSLRKAPTH